MTPGLDHPGDDIVCNPGAPSALGVSLACDSLGACQAFSWVAGLSTGCLKNSSAAPSAASGATCYYVKLVQPSGVCAGV